MSHPLSNLQFHKLKRDDMDTCEHCNRSHIRTDEIEGMGRTLTLHVACAECCDFEVRLKRLNGMIASTRRELESVVKPGSPAALKYEGLLKVQQQKRNKTLFDAKRFFEGINNPQNPSARTPHND